MSEECETQLNDIMGKYGIEIKEFSVMSVNVPENDESVNKLKEAKAMMARLTITGKDVYQMERSFDVLEKAASNEGAGGFKSSESECITICNIMELSNHYK